jgi:DNA-binding CsgD family transcriptional regulator
MMAMAMSAVAERFTDGRAEGLPGDAFVGRSRERRLLQALVGSAGGGGAAGLVLGEPGIGKTALLRQVARTTSHRICWICGDESEAMLPFAAAADLLTPFRSVFGNLPGTQRQALEVALALADGPQPSPLAACTGALGALAAVGDEQPLVVLVDDLQWVDPESRQLMIFVARRLATERIVMLFAARDEPGMNLPTGGLPTMRLNGLELADCMLMAQRLGVTVPRDVLASVVRATGGNPLAVLETITRGSSLTTADDQSVIVGPSVERAWRGVLHRLPARAQHALFVIAISRGPGLPSLPAILDAVQLSLDDLEPAERQGLVSVVGDQVTLRHPLLRCVLMESIPMAVRFATYRALADLARADVSAWYLSQATVGPDREVADRLVTAAKSARRRSGYSAARRLSKRAAELTADDHVRADRLVTAAIDSQLAGDAQSAVDWCEQALSLRADPPFTAAATLIKGRALAWIGEPARGYEALVRVATDIQSHSRHLAAELFAEAIVPAVMTGDIDAAADAAKVCEAAGAAGVMPSFRTLVMVAKSYLLRGDIADGRSRLDAAVAKLGDVDLVADQQALTHMSLGRAWAEDTDAARQLVNSALDAARRHGAPAILSFALAVRGDMDCWAGRWSAAYADACESLHWAEELGQAGVIGDCLMTMARIDAARGDRQLCEARIDQSRQAVGPPGAGWMQLFEQAVLGFAALTNGEAVSAVQYLEAAWDFAQARGVGNPNITRFEPDLIEAHLRCRNVTRARLLLTSLEERARSTGLSYPAAAAARCGGLLADDVHKALDAFAAARQAHDRCSMPFELARTMLCEGEVLRRFRRPTAARSVLRESLGLFERLGAKPWAERAAYELAATGSPSPSRPKAALIDALTPQELQIARLVADGRNNAEAAAAMFLSRKTVETHLTRVYRKLSVRSRTDLTRMLVAHGLAD